MNHPYLSCIYYFVFRSFSFFNDAMYLQKLSSQFSLVLILLSLLPKAKYRFAVSLRIFVRAAYDTPWSHYARLIFAHYLYRVSCSTSIHRTFAPAFCYLFLYHQIAYVAKCENFESSICAIHDALLFFIQVIHRIPIESCICNNHDHYVLLAFIVHLLILNIQLATYAQKYENITILTHSLDHTHHTPFIF